MEAGKVGWCLVRHFLVGWNVWYIFLGAWVWLGHGIECGWDTFLGGLAWVETNGKAFRVFEAVLGVG